MNEVVDKRGHLPDIEGRTLDLGCGANKRSAEDIGVDVIDYPEVDVVGDAFDVLARVPDGMLAGVYSSHFFEHVGDVPLLLDELGRTLRPGSMLEVVVPHFSNPYYYSDLSHCTPFGLYTFSYASEDPVYRRRVPTYGRRRYFRLRSVSLRFKSPPPFYGRYLLKRVVQTLVNLSRWTQEFYEENFCYLLPCYELYFRLERVTGKGHTTFARPQHRPNDGQALGGRQTESNTLDVAGKPVIAGPRQAGPCTAHRCRR